MHFISRTTNVSRLAVSKTVSGQIWDWMIRRYLFIGNFDRGQTMTEYALILAAVAVVVYAGYLTMGTSITGLLTTVDANI